MEKAENDDEHELASIEVAVTSLRTLKSVWDAAELLKTTEIPALKKELAELEAKKADTADSLEAVSQPRFFSFISVTRAMHNNHWRLTLAFLPTLAID